MKDNAVAVINANELLEWLRARRDVVRKKRDEATDDVILALSEGGISELWDVSRQVNRMKHLAGKPADTKEYR